MTENPNTPFFADSGEELTDLGITYRELSEKLKPKNKGNFSAGLFLASMLAFTGMSLDDLVRDNDPEDVPVD